jgi:hypothetical protein
MNLMASAKRLGKTVRAVAAIAVLTIVSAAILAVVVNSNRQRDAREMLDALRKLRAGVTTGRESVLAVKRFLREPYIVKNTFTERGSSSQTLPIPLSECERSDCELAVAPNEAWLEPVVSRLLDHPTLRRWIPVSFISADLSVRHGVLQEISVTMQSVQAAEVHRMRTEVISGNRPSPWNITFYRAHNTGGFRGAGTTPTVVATSTPAATKEQQSSAFTFDVSCLKLGRHCSRCDFSPRICADYEYGNWNYFDMPPNVLEQFTGIVNGVPFGTSEERLVQLLGREDEWIFAPSGGHLSWGERKLDGLPFRFPQGAVFGDGQSSLSYLLKMHRDNDVAPYESVVTFGFDSDDHLVAVESNVAGIRSRIRR